MSTYAWCVCIRMIFDPLIDQLKRLKLPFKKNASSLPNALGAQHNAARINHVSMRDMLFSPQQTDFIKRAMGLSLCIHAIILSIKLVAPYVPNTKNTDSPLEVSLVNTQSNDAPDKADLLAQQNLKGGGEHDKNAFTTPLPAMGDGNGELIKLLKKQTTTPEQEQKILNSPDGDYSIRNNPKNTLTETKELTQGQDAQTINEEIARLEAEISRQIQQMAKRPKRLPLTAANAKAVVYARYYDTIRRKIEDYGTNYFPKDTAGNPMYGDLILVIRVDKQGRLGYNRDGYTVNPVEVARSSGNAELDRRAIEIVKACAPFGLFSPEMERSIDILEVISTFRFNKQGFATTLQGRS